MKKRYRKYLRVDTRVAVSVKFPKSQFDGREGVVTGPSGWGKRKFVHLDGDKTGTVVEFLPSELIPLTK